MKLHKKKPKPKPMKTDDQGAGRGKAIRLVFPEDLEISADPASPLFQPRHADPPDRALVASIIAVGIINPVSVVRGSDGKRYVAAGTRRTIAARQANQQLAAAGLPRKPVPIIIRLETPAEARTIKAIENAQRKDLTDLQRCEEVRQLAKSGYADEQIADLYGVTATTVSQWVKVPLLSTEVQQAIATGRVHIVDALKLGKLPDAEQPAALAKIQAEAPTRQVRRDQGQTGNRKPNTSPASRLRKLGAYVTEHPDSLDAKVAVLVAWLHDEASAEDAIAAFPRLADLFAGKKAEVSP